MATRDIRDKKEDPIDKIVVSDDLFLTKDRHNIWNLESINSGAEVEIDVEEMENLKKALDFILEL